MFECVDVALDGREWDLCMCVCVWVGGERGGLEESDVNYDEKRRHRDTYTHTKTHTDTHQRRTHRHVTDRHVTHRRVTHRHGRLVTFQWSALSVSRATSWMRWAPDTISSPDRGREPRKGEEKHEKEQRGKHEKREGRRDKNNGK